MMKVWVVLGEQGEYSDRNVWTVGVYGTEEGAKRFIAFMDTEHQKIPDPNNHLKKYSKEWHEAARNRREHMSQFDPNWCHSYTGDPNYWIEEHEVHV